MLNNLSILNKIYPQSLIQHIHDVDYCKFIYVVKMWASYFESPEVYLFETLENALNAVRECHKGYENHLTFEISYTSQFFEDDDSITFSECINYEF